MNPVLIVHVGQARGRLADDSMHARLEDREFLRLVQREPELKAREVVHHEVRLFAVLDVMVDLDEVGMVQFLAELRLELERLPLGGVDPSRGEELLDGEPAIAGLVEHFHHDRGRAGVDRPDVLVIPDPFFAGRVRRHGRTPGFSAMR